MDKIIEKINIVIVSVTLIFAVMCCYFSYNTNLMIQYNDGYKTGYESGFKNGYKQAITDIIITEKDKTL